MTTLEPRAWTCNSANHLRRDKLSRRHGSRTGSHDERSNGKGADGHGGTACEREANQARVVIRATSAMMAPIAGMIPIGPFFDDRRGTLPDFPIDTLPAAWRAWIERAAHGAGATPALCGCRLFWGITSSLMDRVPRKGSQSWTQPMTNSDGPCGFFRIKQNTGHRCDQAQTLSQIERNRRTKIAEIRGPLMKAASKQQRQHELYGKGSLNASQKEKSCRCRIYRNKVASEPVMPEAAADPGPFVAPKANTRANVTIERPQFS